ncbi:SPFH domain-containing protein [Halopseudomonas pachastrellae]|nr:SPFH domain-containing protein [Halopseudomonas pachastrellae]
MEIATILSLGFLALVIVALAKTARIVPQRSAFIIERLGKYAKTLDAGFHILIPFVDRVAYKHTLKEEAIDVPSQACVTRDNIQVVVDGVLYLQVVDPNWPATASTITATRPCSWRRPPCVRWSARSI